MFEFSEDHKQEIFETSSVKQADSAAKAGGGGVVAAAAAPSTTIINKSNLLASLDLNGKKRQRRGTSRSDSQSERMRHDDETAQEEKDNEDDEDVLIVANTGVGVALSTAGATDRSENCGSEMSSSIKSSPVSICDEDSSKYEQENIIEYNFMVGGKNPVNNNFPEENKNFFVSAGKTNLLVN